MARIKKNAAKAFFKRGVSMKRRPLPKAGPIRIVKREYTLVDGPMHGQKVWLSEPSTVRFRYRGQVGRYLQRKKDHSRSALYWDGSPPTFSP